MRAWSRLGSVALVLGSLTRTAMAQEFPQLDPVHPVTIEACVDPSARATEHPVLELTLERVREAPNAPWRLEVDVRSTTPTAGQAEGFRLPAYSLYSLQSGGGSVVESGEHTFTWQLPKELMSRVRSSETLPLTLRLTSRNSKSDSGEPASVQIIGATVRGPEIGAQSSASNSQCAGPSK